VHVFPEGPRDAFSAYLYHEEPHLYLFSGSKGGPFLVVGSPALATPTNQNIIPWKPGMYFVHDSDLESWR
jgi:hypothetical protein